MHRFWIGVAQVPEDIAVPQTSLRSPHLHQSSEPLPDEFDLDLRRLDPRHFLPAARSAVPVMPGLEPGIQAASYVIIPRMSALDARVKPVHDETAPV